MNSFAALQSDSDDEEVPKVTKKTTTKTAAKTAVVQPRIPGAPPAKTSTKKQPSIGAAGSAAATDDFIAVDPTMDGKVDFHGGRTNERFGHGGRGSKGPGPMTHKAHQPRHEKDRTKDTKRVAKGGRGPGGWGSAEQEAQVAKKDPEAAVEGAEGAAEEGDVEEGAEAAEAVPKTLTYDEFVAQRNASRTNADVFGSFQERAVVADSSMKVHQKAQLEEAEKEAKAKKQQRAAVRLDVNFTVASTSAEAPRERREGGRGEGRGGRGGDRREGGRGRGESRGRGENRARGDAPRAARPAAGPRVDLNTADFPAL